MLVRQDLINKIKDLFGLNIYETKVWLALLSKGVASAGEVAAISGVPRSRTYDVLESLEKRGFAIAKLEKPVRFIGVKPQIILEKLKNNVEVEAKERILDLNKIKSTEEYEKIKSLYSLGMNPIKKKEVSAALKGKSNISNHLREILQNAQKEVIICTNVSDIGSKSKLFQQTFKELSRKKVKLKIALFGDEKEIREVEKKVGVKIQKIDIEAKFFIVDRTEILFYTSKEMKEELAIWLNSEFFSEAFANMFDIALKER